MSYVSGFPARASGADCESDDENKVFSTHFKDMCKEYCKICFTDVMYMNEHLYMQHELTLPAYREQYGQIVYTHLTYHRCRLCRTRLIFDFEEISEHVKKHNLTFQEYKGMYLDPSSSHYVLEERAHPSFNQGEQWRENHRLSEIHPEAGEAVEKTMKCSQFLTKAEMPLLQDLTKVEMPLLQELIKAEMPLLEAKYNYTGADGRVFSDVLAEQCVFKCEICQKQMVRKQLARHVLKTHNTKFPEYKALYGDYKPIKTTYYRCKICNTEMLFVYEVILDHVRGRHKLNFPEYKMKYQAFYDAPGEERIFTNRLEEMCTYSCIFCGKIILHHLIRRHLKSQHPTKTCNEFTFANKTYYRCVLCGSELLFSKNTIKDHLRAKHKQSFSAYAAIPGAFEGDHSVVSYKPLPANGEGSSKRNKDVVANGGAHSAAAPTFRALNYDFLIGNTYTCLICRHSATSENLMASHSMEDHKIQFKDFRSQYTVTDNYYGCKVCHAEIFHDKDVIATHISKVHQLTLEEYTRMYEAPEAARDGGVDHGDEDSDEDREDQYPDAYSRTEAEYQPPVWNVGDQIIYAKKMKLHHDL